ncbi:MFS transporter [Streptomyces sp. Q6]|uniref:MFS transporter n=1 Tax=Streptomyces citrinus TaxID=3118173 RepID=A0ACD5AK57_9ACTN
MTVISPRSRPAPTRSRPVGRRAWVVTFLLLAFMLLNFADKAVLGFAGVEFKRDLGISAEQFGVLQSSFFWLFAVGAVLLGALTARFKARWLVAALMFLWVAAMVPLLGPVGFGTVLACRIVLGFAEGPAYALATHVVHSWFPPEKRGLPGGLVTAGASIGPLLAAPLLTWVIARWSWHTAFGVLVVAGALWLVAWLTLGKDAPEAGPEASVFTAEALPVEAPLRVLVGTRTVIGIALLTAFAYLATTLKVAWLPLYLNEGLGYGTVTSGWLVTVPYGVAAVAAVSAGLLSNRLTARGVSRRVTRGWLAGGLVMLAGASMYLFTVIDDRPLQMVFISLAFSMNSAAYGVAFIAVGDVVHPEQRGAVMGGLAAFYSLAGILAPLLLGHLVDAAPSAEIGYGNGFGLTGALMVAGGAVAVYLVRPERDLARIRERVGGTR